MTDRMDDMTLPNDDDAAAALFPEFDTLYGLIEAEVAGLTEAQLDWTSDDYAWAEWSIRVQLSHMASLIYRWLLIRWGDVTYPDGDHGVEDVEGLGASPFDRRLDDTKYYDLPVIMEKLEEGVELTRRLLRERDIAFLRDNQVTNPLFGSWDVMIQAYPQDGGVSLNLQSNEVTMSLEGTMRHIYYEEITHLFNIQRLKRAQGLDTVSKLPRVGYWTIPGWDVSEA